MSCYNRRMRWLLTRIFTGLGHVFEWACLAVIAVAALFFLLAILARDIAEELR